MEGMDYSISDGDVQKNSDSVASNGERPSADQLVETSDINTQSRKNDYLDSETRELGPWPIHLLGSPTHKPVIPVVSVPQSAADIDNEDRDMIENSASNDDGIDVIDIITFYDYRDANERKIEGMDYSISDGDVQKNSDSVASNGERPSTDQLVETSDINTQSRKNDYLDSETRELGPWPIHLLGSPTHKPVIPVVSVPQSAADIDNEDRDMIENSASNDDGIDVIDIITFYDYRDANERSSMKLASSLRYFQNPLENNDFLETNHDNDQTRSEDEISISSNISGIIDDLNEYENCKFDSKKKIRKALKLVDYSNNNLKKVKTLSNTSLNRSEDTWDSTVNAESIVLDGFQENVLISNINSDKLEDILQANKVDVQMDNTIQLNSITQKQILSQTPEDLCTVFENPSSLSLQLPSKKKRSEYLNPDSECLTITVDQTSSSSKIGLLPNGGIIISDCGNQRKENEVTYNLSNTCGFDSVVQLIAVSFCDSRKLSDNVSMFDHIPVIGLAIDVSKTNTINKSILSKRFDILKNIFSTTDMPDNMKTINCDCNVVEIIKNLNIHSFKEIKKCSNADCKKLLPSTTFSSILLNFNQENISELQTLIDSYETFQPKEKNCTEDHCNGFIRFQRMYNNLVFIAISCQSQCLLPNEIKNCQLRDIPNFILIGEKTLYLRGIIGYYPPLEHTIEIGHYVCFAKRSNILWEVHDDMNKNIKRVRSSYYVMVALLLFTE